MTEPTETGAGPLRLQVLGRFRLTQPDGTAVELAPSRRVKAVLCYLALRGRAVTRSSLTDMFWSEASGARASLRWTLSRLRQGLESAGVAALVTRGESVAIDLARVEVDLRIVRDLVRRRAEVEASRLEETAEWFGPALSSRAGSSLNARRRGPRGTS